MKFRIVLLGVFHIIAIGNGFSFVNKISRGFSLVSIPFRHHGIVPEYVEDAPKQMLEVRFERFSARLGNSVFASEVTDQPDISWPCEPRAYYTLVMFDIDPLGPKTRLLSEARHWFVGNIHHCDIDSGEIIVDFWPSSPLEGTGQHRYVFLMFKQTKRLNFEETFIKSNELDGRLYTTLKKLVLKYDLGRPIAGNFYYCEYDARVDETFKTFGPNPDYVDRAISQTSLQRSLLTKNLFYYGNKANKNAH